MQCIPYAQFATGKKNERNNRATLFESKETLLEKYCFLNNKFAQQIVESLKKT